eukprot:TRINITY_DN2614_c0_g1_i3.p3 TRINITY_DN2614_c0_g1~~TRINITY_DN2614_c0_g1_i3.p3  ORF type:complete len:216 (+),score=94.00 TRINITY_DN2614_c0_g1_i3:319-966(+)
MFGYGSIIWNPSIPHEEDQTMDRVYITPYQRVFYQASTEHRGSPDAPGRVATLMQPADVGATVEPHDPAWRVYGRAFRLPSEEAAAILESMKEREAVGYHHVTVPVYGADGSVVIARAATNVADVSNKLWRGRTPEERDDGAIAAAILRAEGPSGPNVKYLEKLNGALLKMGCGDDAHVQSLMTHLARLRAEKESGVASGKDDGDKGASGTNGSA